MAFEDKDGLDHVEHGHRVNLNSKQHDESTQRLSPTTTIESIWSEMGAEISWRFGGMLGGMLERRLYLAIE